MKLPHLSACLVRDFTSNKGGCGKDELERLNGFELTLERLEGVDREARRSNGKSRVREDRPLEVIPEEATDVVYDFHTGALEDRKATTSDSPSNSCCTRL